MGQWLKHPFTNHTQLQSKRLEQVSYLLIVNFTVFYLYKNTWWIHACYMEPIFAL